MRVFFGCSAGEGAEEESSWISPPEEEERDISKERDISRERRTRGEGERTREKEKRQREKRARHRAKRE